MKMSKTSNFVAAAVGAAALAGGSAAAEAENDKQNQAEEQKTTNVTKESLPGIEQSFDEARDLAVRISSLFESNVEIRERLINSPREVLQEMGLADIWAEAFTNELGLQDESGGCCVSGGCGATCLKTC